MEEKTGRKRLKKNGGKKKEKTDENSGHYVIASSRPPERRPLERRTLAPIKSKQIILKPPSQKTWKLQFKKYRLPNG